MKKKLPLIIVGFIISYAVMFLVNFMILKKTVTWSEEDIADSLAIVSQSDSLDLTWDLGGKKGPSDKTDSAEQRETEKQLAIKSMMDSVVTAETTPIKSQLDETDKKLAEAQKDVDTLEELLATLASTQDSIDVAKAKRLSKMLEAMKAKQAAAILSRLEYEVNAELLMTMKQKSAAKILAELPRERAAAIARFMSESFARSSI